MAGTCAQRCVDNAAPGRHCAPIVTAFVKVIVMAVVQGLTEFLPVSSSGHLVMTKHFLELDSPGVVLEVALHAGTLLSVLVYYRLRIRRLAVELWKGGGTGRVEIAAILLGTLPAVAAYVAFSDTIEGLFQNPLTTSVMLCVTGVVLLTLHFHVPKDRPLSIGRGIMVGAAQALAMIPGISRSGLTIVAGRHAGLAPRVAAEFSLLLSVPALAGAIVLKAGDAVNGDLHDLSAWMLVAGILVAAAVGYVAIACLVKALSAGRFWMFGIYCLAVGLITGVLLLVV